MPLFDIKPTFAYQLLPDLSIGAGVDIYTFSGLFGEGHAEFRRIVPPGNRVEINGKDTALGFNIGTLYTALRNADGLPIVNVAVVYRSQATLHLDGVWLNNGVKIQDTTTTLVLPQVITGGIAVWPVRNAEREWKLELNVDYIGWKSVRNWTSTRDANGFILPQPQNWKSTYAILVGTEYRWLKMDRLPGWEVAVRGGYIESANTGPRLHLQSGSSISGPSYYFNGIGFLCKGNGSLFGLVACGNLGIGSIKAKLSVWTCRTRSHSTNQELSRGILGFGQESMGFTKILRTQVGFPSA